jgi:hypothetical protein
VTKHKKTAEGGFFVVQAEVPVARLGILDQDLLLLGLPQDAAYFFSSLSAKTQRMKKTPTAITMMVTTMPVGDLIFSTKSRIAPIF